LLDAPAAVLHAWQSLGSPPPQAVSQQTPSTQAPLEHWVASVQTRPLPPAQMPAWQASACVEGLPSSQEEPLGFAGLEQRPVAGMQVPASWHWSGAAHVTGLAPVQVPDWHVSVCVQALLSLHAVPFATGGATHVPVPALQAVMAPHAGKRLSPLTCTGVGRSVVVVSPSWPVSLRPQAQTVPSDFSVTVCSPPAARFTAVHRAGFPVQLPTLPAPAVNAARASAVGSDAELAVAPPPPSPEPIPEESTPQAPMSRTRSKSHSGRYEERGFIGTGPSW